jgi:hypothetical protein
VALVDAGAGKSDILVESLDPLRVRGSAGEVRQVDLALVGDEGGYRPRRSGVSVRLPGKLGAGFDVAGVAVSPGGADVAADVVAGKTFYPSFAADADLWATPLVDGLEIYLQLRSAKSPERFPMRFSLPAGARLQESAVLPGAAEVVRGERRIALVRPPMAWDADGYPVPVSYEVAGDALTVVVPHRAGDYLYPLLVDPAIIEDQRSWKDNAALDYLGWRYETNSNGRLGYSSGAGALGSGLYVFDRASTAVNVGDVGQWRFDAPGTAFVMRAEFARVSHEAGRACVREGIKRSDGIYEPGAWMRDGETVATNGSPTPAVGACEGQSALSDDTKVHCTSTTCGQHGTPGNSAVFSHEVWNSGADHDRYTYMGGARVYLSDIDRPNFASYGFNGPTGWVHDVTGTVDATVTDSGLGVKKVVINSPDSTEWSGESYDPPCRGDRTDRCPQAPDPQQLSFNTAGLPEGIRTIRTTALDIVDNDESRSGQVKIDRSGPDIALSGPLYDRRGQEAPNGLYQVHADATDGDGSSDAMARSGVVQVELRLDDSVEAERYVDCSTHSCALDLDWAIDTSELAGGVHRVDVVATDALDHERIESFEFSKGCCLEATTSSTWLGEAPNFSDVTGDEAEDAVSRDLVGRMQVAASNAEGFDQPAVWSQQLVVGDFEVDDADADGLADVLWHDVSGDLRIMRSDGTAFEPATSGGTAPKTLQVKFADVDGDVRADAVLYDGRTGVISVRYADAETGGFQPATTWTTWNTGYDLRLADVTGDDLADAIGRNSAGDVRVAVSDAGSFEAPTTWGHWANDHLAFQDVDGDGLTDILGKNRLTSAVTYGSSTGDSFEAPKELGVWVNTGLDAADVTGDGRADLAGIDPLGTQIAVARSVAPTPAEPAATVATPVADVDIEPDALLAAGETVGAEHPPSGEPRLGSQDDPFLAPDVADKDTPGPYADAVYRRLREAGVTLVRFNAFWGGIQNRAGSPEPYTWTRLDAAIKGAMANKMKVHLTFTGVAGRSMNECTLEQDNPHGIGCEPVPNDPEGYKLLAQRRPTGINPSASRITDFGKFVEAGIERYANDPLRQVHSIAIWNEPNLHQWLMDDKNPLDASGTAKVEVIPTGLYRQLYKSAYAGWMRAAPGTHPKPQILMGELSSGAQRAGYSPGSTTYCPGPQRCRWDPVEFLRAVVLDGSGDLTANGLAYHPYQEWTHPDTESRRFRPDGTVKSGSRQDIGINRLGDVSAALNRLCAPFSNRRCASNYTNNRLKSPNNKRPGLYLTEFGYRNQPTPREKKGVLEEDWVLRKPRGNGNWHTEVRRSQWFAGRKGALPKASASEANWMLLYHAIERPPKPLSHPEVNGNPLKGAAFEYGLFALEPARDSNGNPIPGSDITLDRPYGKNSDRKPRSFRKSQERLSYCLIRRWALRKGYFDPAASMQWLGGANRKNRCPGKAAWHDGD